MLKGLAAGLGFGVVAFVMAACATIGAYSSILLPLGVGLAAGVAGFLGGGIAGQIVSSAKGPLTLAVGLDGIRVRKRFIP